MSPTGRDTTWAACEVDCRSETYNDSRMHRWQADVAVSLLDPQPGQHVLDIAAGIGLAARLRCTGSPRDIIEIDISSACCRCMSNQGLTADDIVEHAYPKTAPRACTPTGPRRSGAVMDVPRTVTV